MAAKQIILKGNFVMKKNLALLIAFVMLFSCMLGIMPAADETTGGASTAESYEPTIAYSNVNYIEDLTLMFAVPAPAADALAEGSTVKVVIWTAPSTVYSYGEVGTKNAEETEVITFALEAEEAKAEIGGVEHLVFKYEGLAPEKMTDVIYARAIVVDKDGKAAAYSDVLDYSVVEYVETAKGGFNGGAPVIADEKVVSLLDSMLFFGATVQKFADRGDPYVPNGYYANDELHKIWVTPVVAGKTLDKVFGGFFKYEEYGYATVREPFFDGRVVVAYKDADGNVLEDACPGEYDEEAGFQLNAVDGDIEVLVEYGSVAIRELTADAFGEGFAVNNVTPGIQGNPDILASLGSKYTSAKSIELSRGHNANFSGDSGVGGTNYYNGLRTIADPSDPENLLLLATATSLPTFGFGSRQYITPDDYVKAGYGDTIEEAVTIEVSIGKPSPDANVNIASMYFRNRTAGVSEAYFNVFLVENNVVKLSADKSVICTLPDTGLVKIAITILGSGELKAYYSDADGNMVLALERDRAAFPATYESATQYFTENTLQLQWTFGKNLGTKAVFDEAEIEVDGVMTKVIDDDGVINPFALQAYAEKHYSFLLDEWKFYVGDVYN